MKLDIPFVRSQFNQIQDNPDFIFCSNAGGSYVANQVNEVMSQYNRHNRVQPYERYESSAIAGKAMDRALQGWAKALNIAEDELTIGPSTSMNTYVVSQAIGSSLDENDEIIVTNQDHEANSGVWRRKAEECGSTIKEWRVDPESGLLDPEDLRKLLTDKTRWVFFTHCSNIIGTANPVKQITEMVKANSNARVFVDAVAYAPHHICDLKDLDVDGYAFSLYKVFGPHQGLLYIAKDAADSMTPQSHYFNIGNRAAMFNPAGPQHAQVATCAGVLDYFEDLHSHHYGDTSKNIPWPEKMADIYSLIQQHENLLAAPLLDYLDNNKNIRLLGKNHINDNDRAPTIAFKPLNQSSESLSHRIQDHNIGCESSNFYAHRLITDLGIEPEDGVVRISLVHYSSEEEVDKILLALDASMSI
jgi:cysteine desulfurase family protein (TIGR01976 family)